MAKKTITQEPKIREAGTEVWWNGEVHRPDEKGQVWLPQNCVNTLVGSHGFRLVKEPADG
jgi:hypothetical protein